MSFNFIYTLFHDISAAVFSTFFDAECFGLENVPKEGPFILACNHTSFLDPFVAACFFRRPIYFFARKTLFKNALANWLLRRMNAIPVDRDEGRDPSALKKVLKLLKTGEGVLVFVEGTRSIDGTLQEAKRGVGLMACRTGVPVIPLRIFGTYEAWGRNRRFPSIGSPITLVYGQPIYPQIYDPAHSTTANLKKGSIEMKDRYQTAADKILERIKALAWKS